MPHCKTESDVGLVKLLIFMEIKQSELFWNHCICNRFELCWSLHLGEGPSCAGIILHLQ